ncbi:unnamed protein product [Phytophthora lilii]|uniref:Unnamed protein product n=1 Tax=Phytophthora lilii TaxID=2077276 RepID=A0A9W6XAQ2_9STRA|nr:unnamed protein product [Phytophthora lilii]
MKKLTEMPFLRELMGFSSGVLYVDPRQNAFPPFDQEFVRNFGFGYGLDKLNDMLNCRGTGGELNAIAIYICSKLDNGPSMSVNASGDAFFIGTTANGKPVTSNVLVGSCQFRVRRYGLLSSGLHEARTRGNVPQVESSIRSWDMGAYGRHWRRRLVSNRSMPVSPMAMLWITARRNCGYR